MLQARKIEEWKIHKKLRDEEREIKQRKARAQAAQKARAEAAKAKAETGSDEDATGFADFLGAMDDPEITSLLNDPGELFPYLIGSVTLLTVLLSFCRGC